MPYGNGWYFNSNTVWLEKENFPNEIRVEKLYEQSTLFI